MDTKSNEPANRDKINRHDYIKSILDRMQEYAIYSDSYYLAIGRSTLKIIVSDIFDDLIGGKIEIGKTEKAEQEKAKIKT